MLPFLKSLNAGIGLKTSAIRQTPVVTGLAGFKGQQVNVRPQIPTETLTIRRTLL